MYRRVLRCCSHDYLLDEGRSIPRWSLLMVPVTWARLYLCLAHDELTMKYFWYATYDVADLDR